MYDKCYSDYRNNIEANIPKNPKLFWSFIKHKRGSDSSIPASMNLKDQVVKTGPDIVNLFAEHFASIYLPSSTPPDNFTLESQCCGSPQRMLCSLAIEEIEVLKAIKKIDSAKGAGPDGIPPVFGKRCGSAVALPLSLIFNRSLADGTFPSEWKKARIVPVFKKGENSDVKNYRPISILSCFSKLFESIVYPVIFRLVDSSISDSQHGFRRGRSIVTNLVPYISNVSNEVDSGRQVDAIYTDFSSAFDRVNHSILLRKLCGFGVDGPLLKWFESYLQQRPQSVSVNGFNSKTYFADTGVPQGSHLGPLLFIIFINDIVDKVSHCKVSLFADDLKIYKTIVSVVDCRQLQSDLDAILQWCRCNSMTLNANKCFHIKFTRKRKQLATEYKLDGTALAEVNEIRDLGVIVDSQLKFTSHINKSVTKAAQMLGFLKRNSGGFRRQRTKILLYQTLVRSHLEFASVVWNPYYAVHSQRVESIQRAFTRHLAYNSSGFSHRNPYKERLIRFRMCSLRERRLLLDMSFFHKVVSGQYQCSYFLENMPLRVPRTYPRGKLKYIFYTPPVKSNLGRQAPLRRIIDEYHSLITVMPDLDVFHDKLRVFKDRIGKEEKGP